jgi:hypothetical protein
MTKKLFKMPVSSQLKFLLLPLIAIAFSLSGCSKVHILKPSDGATFAAGQTIEFEGEITRSIETGGADRSDDLSWDSSITGHLGDGRSLTSNTLSAGSHSITASWPNHNRSDRISIKVNP